MAVLRQGDILSAPGIALFGACSSLTPEGELVMDQNVRRKLDTYSPGMDKAFGKVLQDTCGHLGCYGLILYGRCGIFQIGFKFNEINMDLFRFSMSKLSENARRNWYELYDIDAPSIGNGKETIDDFKPILEMLPANVRIWREDE